MIYIVSHKRFIPPNSDDYTAIYVGDKIRDHAQKNGLLTDDLFEKGNIAAKNPTFCELTALYWIWKNDADNRFIGLNHYRRFFLSKKNKGEIVSEDEIRSSLEKSDIILPRKLIFRYDIRRFYCLTTGYEKDLLLIGKIIDKRYPEYLDTYHFFLSGKEMVYANMFVMSRDKLDAYCRWLFDILFQAEKELDMSGYTQAEKRVFGYIGELLLNVWVIHNKLKVDYFEIINTEINDDIWPKVLSTSKKIAKRILYFPSGIPYRRRLKKGYKLCRKG